MQEKISVIVPVYNTQAYLSKCLESITGQTYANLEIILVDDGSTDSSGQICDKFAALDRRAKVIHQPNGGASLARNAGLDAATGDWVGFVDSDDFIEPDMYAYLLDLALCHNADIAQCGVFWDEPDNDHVLYLSSQKARTIEGLNAFGAEEWRIMANSTYCKLYRRDILKGIRYNPDFVIGEDLLFNFYALQKALVVVFGDLAKYHYVQREGSLCRAAVTPQKLVSYHRMLEYAALEFVCRKTVMVHLRVERLRNYMDMCSKIICFELPGTQDIVLTLRRDIRRNLSFIFSDPAFAHKDRLKLLLIAWFWPFYRKTLPTWKKLS